MAQKKHDTISMKGIAIAAGLSWAISLLFFGWAAVYGWGTQFVLNMSSIYMGYEATFWGAVRGAIWGFVYGAIIGCIFAYFYNWVVSGRRR